MNKAKKTPIDTQNRWLDHFRAREESGLTPTEYCKLKRIPLQHFYQARYRFREEPRRKLPAKTRGFQKIEILPELPARPSPVMLFRVGAVDFEVSEAAPSAYVAKILQELNRELS